MQIYQAGHYDCDHRWIDDEQILIGVGSPFSAERREGAYNEHGTWQDSGPRTKVEGTVHQITDDSVHVQYNDGGGAVVADVYTDKRLELNAGFEAIRFGPPPVPLGESFAGDLGYEHQRDCAGVQLRYSPNSGWFLQTWEFSPTDALPEEIWNKRVLSYVLARASIAVLRDEDRDGFIEPLGADLPQLLARIAAGHSIEWNGQNLAGEFTPDAWEAHEELECRIEDAEITMPDTWYAGDFFNDYMFETGDTPELLLAEAESEEIRIWEGTEAIAKVMAEHITPNGKVES